MLTAFRGQVTFQNKGDMLVAPAYRVGENCVGSVLAALAPSNPPKATKMAANEFHNIYGHASKTLLRTTANRLGVELTGKMHACTGCSMAKAYRCLLYTSPSPRDS